MFRADLHTHSNLSDGTLSPQELLLLAKESGLSGMSITDHDTIEAYRTAPHIAQELALKLGTGVEFSSQFRKISVHVLCYDFDLKSYAIHTLCERHQQRRKERNQKILEKLSRLKMPLDEQELLLLGKHSVGRPHIAQLMVQKGYVTSISQAFQLYLSDAGPCYDPGDCITTEETLQIIHQGGGKAFLAHPYLIKHGRMIKELLKLPFDGIECYYGRLVYDQTKKWVDLAKERKLLISGGSDFHGATKEYTSLGSSWVDEETFHQIFQRSC